MVQMGEMYLLKCLHMFEQFPVFKGLFQGPGLFFLFFSAWYTGKANFVGGFPYSLEVE